MLLSVWIILLVLASLGLPTSKCQPSPPPKEPCVFKRSDSSASCPPCPKQSWLDLVGIKEDGSDETITNPAKDCFNSDPIQVNYVSSKSAADLQDEHSLVAAGPYKIPRGENLHGFIIRKNPFFRYAYDTRSAATSGPPRYLDLTNVSKYYTRDSPPAGPADADFQLFEWPGDKAEFIIPQREQRENAARESMTPCQSEEAKKDVDDCKTVEFYMLEFERDNGKIEHYPCNLEEGSNLVAVGGVQKIDADTKANIEPRFESEQKIWLAHGRESIFKNYVMPLMAPKYVLAKMATDKEPTSADQSSNMCSMKQPDCDAELSDPGQKTICNERCMYLNKIMGTKRNCDNKNFRKSVKIEQFYGDLRTVHDFAFARHRLILGMRCGILLVQGILTDNLRFAAAKLKTSEGERENLFKEPINKVSASTCCLHSHRCGHESQIVAAYSQTVRQDEEKNKYLYVSFNVGSTFEKRIIASPHSPLNLVRGLYKLYEDWNDYYEILSNPDADDLKEDDHNLATLRKKPAWEATIADEKEKLFSLGVHKEQKDMTMLRKILEIKYTRVRDRRKRRIRQKKSVNTDRTPVWVTKTLTEIRNQSGWQSAWSDENCTKIPECAKKFEEDIAVKWLLNGTNITIMTPKRDEDEPYCKEITSIQIIPEESCVLALCIIGKGKLDQDDKGGGAPPGPPTPPPPVGSPPPPPPPSTLEKKVEHLAIFRIQIQKNIPVMFADRISRRIITCEFIINDMNSINYPFYVQPEIYRTPGAPALFIKNCLGVLFSSSNFGNTVFNTVFYFRHHPIHEYCTSIPGNPAPPETPDKCVETPDSIPTPDEKYIRSFRLCSLNVPPLILSDVSGQSILITFGRFSARGAISQNQDQRLIVGETMEHLGIDRRFENLVFPYLDTTGQIGLTVALKHTYSIDNTHFQKIYKDRHALRLLPIPMQFSLDLRNYHVENLAMCFSATMKRYTFQTCKTNSFSAQPKEVHLDINDVREVVITVRDINPFLPLWISSSNEDSTGIKAHLTSPTLTGKNVHTWTVEVKAKANYKKVQQTLVEAFFGADYNILNTYSTQVSFVNTPTVRCHVQPSSILNTKIGCKGKKLVAHEDSHRPQCKMFRKNFNYTLKMGSYDPELANYWIQNDKTQLRPFFTVLDNGDLSVTYDYSGWGCPLEPFRSDLFIPDLRIVDESINYNSSRGTRFEGKFILIEIFGAKGFAYSYKVRDAACRRAPQNLAAMKEEWKIRRRLFKIAESRLKFPISNPETGDPDLKKDVGGNYIFNNDAVRNHLNIWNRANYRSCKEEPTGPEEVLTEEILGRPYEILQTREFEGTGETDVTEDIEEEVFSDVMDESSKEKTLNEVSWDKDHQRVYVFLAIAVDEHDSLCNYETIFGVSLSVNPDMDDLASFIVFLLFVLFWFLLVVGGYHLRKRYLRSAYLSHARSVKLEEAAWRIVYRYERLIHGTAVNNLMAANPEEEPPPTENKVTLAARSAHDKRKGELRMKKTHIMAQEQARHERLQKLFQKQ